MLHMFRDYMDSYDQLRLFGVSSLSMTMRTLLMTMVMARVMIMIMPDICNFSYTDRIF